MKLLTKLTLMVSICAAVIGLAGCGSSSPSDPKSGSREATSAQHQECEIRALIEQLVYADKPVSEELMLTPGLDKASEHLEKELGKRKRDDSDDEADDEPTDPATVDPEASKRQQDEHRRKWEVCRNAFEKLRAYKAVAFPILVEHLDDKRQSIPFRNHFLDFSVGAACYWNIYFQLQDRPDDYSQYGLGREGRDGKFHTKPYWEGSPFDDEDDLKNWLERNKKLSYPQMQVKCLQWLLEREKNIGACDAESYFINILPLEIRILERRLESGEDVQKELSHWKRVRDEKLVNEIPKELLPEGDIRKPK